VQFFSGLVKDLDLMGIAEHGDVELARAVDEDALE